jgi:hypothetical protein
MTGRLRTLATRPDSLAALALGCLYIAVIGAHNYSIDGLLMYRQAVSIVQNHSLRFAVPIYWGDTYTSSKYGIGLSLLYLPGVSLASWFGLVVPTPQANVYDWDLFYRDPVYALGAAPISILLTVATAYLVARFIRELGYGSRVALFGLVAFGIASPAIVYSRGDFAQPLLGFCLIAGLLAAVRFRRSGSVGALIAGAGALFLAVLTRPVEGSFMLPALVAIIAPNLRLRRWQPEMCRAVAVVGGAYVAAVVVTLLVNWGRFGSALQSGYSQVSWGTPICVGLPGVLVSPARGILWQFPLIVLAPFGLLTLWRSQHRLLAIVITGLTTVLLLNTALWVPWWGAQSWGSRLFVPALPVVAVAAAIGTLSLRPDLRKWLPAVLLLGGIVWALPGTVTNLLGGYAARYDGSAQSFALSGYPPVGAWRFLHHLGSQNLNDANGLDIAWFRLAQATHNLSVAVPVVLMLLGCFLAIKAARLERASVEGSNARPSARPEPTSGL